MRRSQLRVSFCYIESKATSYVGVILVERLSSTDSTEIDSDPNAIDNEHTEMSLRPRKKKGTRGKIKCITSELVSTLDRCKVSDVAAVRILIAAARAFGCDPRNYIINRASIRECRSQNREQIVEFMKANPQVIVARPEMSIKFLCTYIPYLMFFS